MVAHPLVITPPVIWPSLFALVSKKFSVITHTLGSTHTRCGAPVHGALSPGVGYLAHTYPTKSHPVNILKGYKLSPGCALVHAIR